MIATFGEYIRQLRSNKCLTLTELAALLKLDSANLSKIENGKREFDEKRLNKLAEIFNLDLEQLRVEYFSDQFAKKIYEYKCSSNAFKIAEEKVNYLYSKDIKENNNSLK